MPDVSGNAMTTLKLNILYIFITSTIISCTSSTTHMNNAVDNSKSDTLFDGSYTGLEYDRITTDPVYPGKEFKAFHKGWMKIKKDSVFFDQTPILVYDKDTSHSASDGGFFFWRGTKTKNDTAIVINLTEYYSDYAGVLVRINAAGKEEFYPRTKELIAKFTPDGLLIKGYLYRKVNKMDTLASELPKPHGVLGF